MGLSNTTQAIPPPPLPPLETVSTMPGMWLLVIGFLFGIIILILVVSYIVVNIWGYPMLVTSKSRISGDAIVQHFETGKNGRLKLARIEGHALRHTQIKDGTMISIPQGVHNLDGHHIVLSWGLFGVSIPVFLMAGITRLKKMGYNSREDVEKTISENPELKKINLISGGYNFSDFKRVLQKSKSPVYMPLEIEHTSDFVENVNQQYTESDVNKELDSYMMNIEDDFGKIIFLTGIAVMLTSVGVWLMVG